ncbi:heavy-metal-associated domain-containing protein [Agrococcus jejuensis]|uniref:Copper chaperone CopZ n=1 Tax=Agrococcus jejuensis TaxID=399736 RepID=A0A1G8AXY1_9MICO|nr:cation transporter [Agrococcus jejuensis]SDH25829.1 Copper chaperone CopZ [Agrococcus jejuensis]
MQQDVEITTAPQAPEQSGCCGGGCCGGGAAETAAPAQTQDFAVTGMTCGHCVSSVTEELGAIAGVRGVEVDLVAGGTSTVRVDADGPLDVAAVRAAVDEAGYTLVG